jgi:hypothetical protein
MFQAGTFKQSPNVMTKGFPKTTSTTEYAKYWQVRFQEQGCRLFFKQ